MKKMETWEKCAGSQLDIKQTYKVAFEEGGCSLMVTTQQRRLEKIEFPYVYDFRYTLREVLVSRMANFTQDGGTGIYLVKESSYLRYFEQQVSGTISLSDVKHYVILSASGYCAELLSPDEPIVSERLAFHT